MLSLDVLDSSLRLKHCGLSFGQVGHDYSSTLFDGFVLFNERSLDLDRGCLLRFSLLLIRDHPFELLVGFSILGLEFRPFDCETLPEFLYLGDSVAKFVKTDMKMALLLLEFITFLSE